MADVRWRHQLRTGNDTNDPSPLSKPTTERHNTIYNGTGHTYIGPEARWPALLYTSDPPSVFKTIGAKRPGHKVVFVYLFHWGRPLNEHKITIMNVGCAERHMRSSLTVYGLNRIFATQTLSLSRVFRGRFSGRFLL